MIIGTVDQCGYCGNNKYIQISSLPQSTYIQFTVFHNPLTYTQFNFDVWNIAYSCPFIGKP